MINNIENDDKDRITVLAVLYPEQLMKLPVDFQIAGDDEIYNGRVLEIIDNRSYPKEDCLCLYVHLGYLDADGDLMRESNTGDSLIIDLITEKCPLFNGDDGSAHDSSGWIWIV